MDIIATHKTSSIIVLQYQNNAFMQNLLIVSRYIWNLYFISGSACYVSIYCLHCTLAIILHACLENLLMLCKFKTVFLNFICQQCGVEHLFICVLWSNITYIVPKKKRSISIIYIWTPSIVHFASLKYYSQNILLNLISWIWFATIL